MPIETELLHKMQQLIFLSLCYTPKKYGQISKKAKGKQAKQKVRAIKSKVKGLGQAFFPKGLRVSRGRSHLVATAAVVNYVYLRNPFADCIND